MPDIIMVGFASKDAPVIEEKIKGVLKEIKEDQDTRVRAIPDVKEVPHLIVRKTSGKRAEFIAKALREKLSLEVYYDSVGEFLAGD